jgi:hypothetical protein
MEEGIVFIKGDIGISYLIITLSLLGIIFTDSLLTALRLELWPPKLLGATVGALLGLGLIEAVLLFT